MRDFLENQFQNMFLFVPFIMAFGAALYFTASNIPDVPYVGIITIAIAGIILFGRKYINILICGILIFIFGFCYAATFTHIINTPQISRNIRDATIIGNVIKIDYTDAKSRIYINVNSADINAIGRDNAIIRVSIGDDIILPNVGDTVRATVNLFRPSNPYAPNSFDYARWAYFNKLTATGYITDLTVVSESDKILNINSIRDYLHKSANSFLADSLVLGYKNAVPKTDAPIWTATGVGHVWSISGFHMTLVSGWLFGFFYLIFRLIAPITRRVPARIPALICAWIGLLFYLFLSGIDVATVRAFLMTTLIFAAFIFGRSAISMRNICVAFCIIFLINPHYVMQAGFQLSFSAIFGLVWIWNVVKPKMPHNKIIKVIYTAVITSVIATIFTAPFVIAHFYSMPIYGLIGNLILLPVFSFAIMPLVMIGTLTAIIGWHMPLNIADSIYNYSLALATRISDLPYASITFPPIPNSAMVFIILGFMALLFIRPIRIKINYILFGAFISVAIIITAIRPRPVFYASADHELVAFMVGDDTLEFNKSRASNHFFAFDTWKQFSGLNTNTPNKRRKHKNGVYIYNTSKFNLAYIQKFVPLKNNIEKLCNDDEIDYIVSYFNVRAPKCNHKILRGGFVIYESGKVQYINANRPWHNPHE